jgi:hypothetical protein
MTPFVDELISVVSAQKPSLPPGSVWRTVTNQGTSDVYTSHNEVAMGVPITALVHITEAAAFYRTGSVEQNVTPANVGDLVNATLVERRIAEVDASINATRQRGVSPDGLAYLALAEDYAGIAAETKSFFDRDSARLDLNKSAEAAQDMVASFDTLDATVWMGSELVAQAARFPGRLDPTSEDAAFVSSARNASQALPSQGPPSILSPYQLAKNRLPPRLALTERYGWHEGSTAIADEILLYAHVAARFAAQPAGSTLQNASQTLDRISASLRSPLDDWDAQRAWEDYTKGATDPGGYTFTEESANIADARMNANLALLA